MWLIEVTTGDIVPPTPTYTFTINPTPENATVTINGEIRKSLTAEENTLIEWIVEAEGYISQSGNLTLTEDKTLDVVLEEQPSFPVDNILGDVTSFEGTSMLNAEHVLQNGYDYFKNGTAIPADDFVSMTQLENNNITMQLDKAVTVKKISVLCSSNSSSTGMLWSCTFYKPDGSSDFRNSSQFKGSSQQTVEVVPGTAAEGVNKIDITMGGVISPVVTVKVWAIYVELETA